MLGRQSASLHPFSVQQRTQIKWHDIPASWARPGEIRGDPSSNPYAAMKFSLGDLGPITHAQRRGWG